MSLSISSSLNRREGQQRTINEQPNLMGCPHVSWFTLEVWTTFHLKLPK